MRKTAAGFGLVASAALLAPGLLGAATASAAPTDPPADFSYQVLSEDVYDPMDVQVAPDGRVLVAQRDGKIKVWHQDGKMVTAGQLPVNAARGCTTCAETINDDGGIYAMLLDRNFAKTGWVYLWYGRAKTGNPGTNLEDWRLSRLHLTPGDKLDLKSEKVLFSAKAWYLDPEGSQAHYGGVLEWLPDGTLLLGTGDETDPKSSGGYGPRDNTRAKGYYWNAELTAQNPASPWGKILRFNADGSLPDGRTRGVKANPFIGKSAVDPYIPDGTNHVKGYNPWGKAIPKNNKIKFNPFVYALGFKQPWRGSVDPKTGNMFIGEVGPDANSDDAQKGPVGHEEINTIPAGGGGNYGWPRCVGPNLAYHDYDWARQVDKGVLSCAGMTKPDIWYTNVDSKGWPLVGAGAKTSEATTYYGPSTGSLKLPGRFNDTVILMDWSRGYMFGIPVKAGRLNTDGNTWQVIRPAVPGVTFVGVGASGVVPKQANTLAGVLPVLDAATGRDGALYLAEYGSGYGNNPLSRLSRIVCTGCTPNPAKDFVRTPGVPVVSAAGAYRPVVSSAPPVRAKQGTLSATGIGGVAGAALLLVVGLRRRRHTPA
jgi:glucose/arabinose dehydrogenase